MLRTGICLLLFLKSVCSICNNEMQQGPYILKPYEPLKVPISRLKLPVRRVQAVSDKASFTIGYRSLWKSYCYQGGPLDPNTGCIDGILNYAPDLEELKSWDAEGACFAGREVNDAWGSDSDVCSNYNKKEVSYPKKELQKRSNNNHFAHHTCNLSWRCGFSLSNIRVELEFQGNGFVTSTVLPNGTRMELNEHDKFWTQGEFSYYVFSVPKVVESNFDMGCFFENATNGKNYFCRDDENKKMFKIDLDNPRFCEGAVCYIYDLNHSDFGPAVNIVEEARNRARPFANHTSSYHNALVNGGWETHSASLRDLQITINEQIFETETLRYNLAELDHRFSRLSELFDLLVNSIAKIDDRLIGKLLGESAASKFLSEEQFVLYPCSAPVTVASNCFENSIFQDGRWIHNEDKSKCIKLGKSKEVDLFQFKDLWIPSIVQPEIQGLIQDQEGWSFVASSKESLKETMLFTKNGGKTTSLQDVLNYPKGWIDSHLNGLLFGNIFSVLAIVIIIVLICKIFSKF